MKQEYSPLVVGMITVLILAAGAGAWSYIKSSAPRPSRTAPQEVARLVSVDDVKRQSVRPQWQAGGTVSASNQVDLMAEVSGTVVFIAPEAVPGATLKKGTLLARIDKTDYQLALKQAEASFAQSSANIDIEQGQVALAEEEYRLSGITLSESDKALVLREPQLKSADANVASARAAVEQAKANLKRTEIRMPFDGQIMARNISQGGRAATSTTLFSLVSIDEFWIEIKLPRSFLNLLDAQYPVTISQPGWGKSTRTAQVLNILPDVDSMDRQAKVILTLKEPLNSDNGPLVLVNDYVDTLVFGRELNGNFVIPRRYLMDDQSVWVVNEKQLEKRNVIVEYQGRDNVWISSGFEADDRLLTSQIDAAVPGMLVRVAGEVSDNEIARPVKHKSKPVNMKGTVNTGAEE